MILELVQKKEKRSNTTQPVDVSRKSAVFITVKGGGPLLLSHRRKMTWEMPHARLQTEYSFKILIWRKKTRHTNTTTNKKHVKWTNKPFVDVCSGPGWCLFCSGLALSLCVQATIHCKDQAKWTWWLFFCFSPFLFNSCWCYFVLWQGKKVSRKQIQEWRWILNLPR